LHQEVLSLSPVPFVTLWQYAFESDVLVFSLVGGCRKVVEVVWVVSITARASWVFFLALSCARGLGSLWEHFELHFLAFAFVWHWLAAFHQRYDAGSGKRVTLQLEGRTCHSEGFKRAFTSSNFEPNSKEV
jgi:hypothetical protein